MSQEEVSQKLGFPARSITRWEHGEVEVGAGKLARMAELFGVSMDWISGRTDLKHCIRPGAVLIDPDAIDELARLADAGASFREIPPHLLRPPGVNCAVVVPENAEVVSSHAATAVESRLREIWRRLGGKTP